MVETTEEKAARLEQELADANARLAENRNEIHVDNYRQPKIPPFFRSDPAYWFYKVEASFRACRITVEGTKADSVIAALDHDVAISIKDIVMKDPQPEDVYKQIKTRLIATYALSAESKLRQLLKGQVLNDGKPSLILSRLRNLADDTARDDSILKSIFFEQLPAQHRAILAASGVQDLNQLALMADKIAENMTPADSQIATISQESKDSDVASEVKHLADMFSKFSTRLQKLENANKNQRSRSKSQSSEKKGRNRSKSRDPSGLCIAHKKYPDNPTSCRKWCSHYAKWSSEN